MTIIAVVATRDVGWVLAGCCSAVMTRATCAGYLGMVDHVRRRPDVAVVAVFTNVGGLYVGQGFTGGLDTIVTAEAISDDADMVKIGRSPGDGRMAVVASIATGDVGWVLADRCNAIMAGAAGTHYMRVINGEHRREHVGVMAVFADIARLNVR